MHNEAAILCVQSIRRRIAQGDCPTEPAFSVERLEHLVDQFAPRVPEAGSAPLPIVVPLHAGDGETPAREQIEAMIVAGGTPAPYIRTDTVSSTAPRVPEAGSAPLPNEVAAMIAVMAGSKSAAPLPNDDGFDLWTIEWLNQSTGVWHRVDTLDDKRSVRVRLAERDDGGIYRTRAYRAAPQPSASTTGEADRE